MNAGRAGSRPAALQPRRPHEGHAARPDRTREARVRDLPQAGSGSRRRREGQGPGDHGSDGAGHLRPRTARAATRCSSTSASSRPAPHVKPEQVRAFVQQALAGYIREQPGRHLEAGLGVPPRAAELSASARAAGAERGGVGDAPRGGRRAAAVEQDLRRMPRRSRRLRRGTLAGSAGCRSTPRRTSPGAGCRARPSITRRT